MRFIAITVAVILALSIAVDAACKGTVNGQSYDLSPLTKTSDNYHQTDSAGFNYYWNFCSNTVASGGGNPCGSSALAYQTDSLKRAGSCQSCAASSAGLWEDWKDASSSQSKGIMVTWDGGALCSTGPRKFTVRLSCDETVESKISSPISENPHCHYIVDMATKHVCSGGGGPSGGMSAGWTLILIVGLGMVFYCGGGFVYLMKVKERQGSEAIPNVEFWRDLPVLVKDGIKFTIAKIRGKGSDSYETVA